MSGVNDQVWKPEQYAQNARFVSDLGAPVVDLLSPRPRERVLDLGCGDGALTEKLVESGCRVVAVDGSAEQVAAARARGLDARVEQAERLSFFSEFDAVFSNAVLHWVKDQQSVLRGVWQALKPGGRFVAEMGGVGCVQSIRFALYEALTLRGIDPSDRDPWFFPDRDEYQALLSAAGFVTESIDIFPRPTPLPGDLKSWLETFAQPFLSGLNDSESDSLLTEVEANLRPQLLDEDQGWVADYVRLRFAARKGEA